MNGHFERAFLSYDRVLKMDPKNPKAWYQKGTTLQRLERNDEALDCYEKALELNPMNMYIWFSKALLFASMGRVGEAVRAFDGALAIQDVPEVRRLRDALVSEMGEEAPLLIILTIIQIGKNTTRIRSPFQLLPAFLREKGLSGQRRSAPVGGYDEEGGCDEGQDLG